MGSLIATCIFHILHQNLTVMYEMFTGCVVCCMCMNFKC